MRSKMKQISLLLIIYSFSFSLFAQEKEEGIVIQKNMPSDFLILNFNTNTWLNAPSNVAIKPVSLGCEIYGMPTLFGKESVFSMAVGAGFSSHGVKNNVLPTKNASGVTEFVDIAEDIDYIKNKFSAIYLDVPLELRIRTKSNNKNRSFRVALGAKAGYLINSFTKYKGEAPDKSGDDAKTKEYHIKNILDYRYGLIGRIGYGKVHLTGYYSLSNLFQEGKGPEMTPASLGLSVVLY